ncbi:chemotaxis protein CheW [Marinibactrum halimedae]|uniref:Chemotaxis protein CheW n=1 Tax=Marinibactrum halimedae TaxID=1444977 RepID=A0AA37T5X1_9GAMM|nr:chemotaxis protein CheW [Marinibactrum halimedae]MCD9460311.1 chemotaxis protein CheW [Marinibactrum halimedae]GLS24401.1 chemotaxis protein CheW [Marinibactrum halimedae]
MNESAEEYLTFFLDNEEFGVDILRVQEIMVWSPVTAIPGTPSYLKGVINLRGVIVPIVDMRERFGGVAREYGATTVVIVLRMPGERATVLGLVVDAVSEVYKVTNDQVRPSPDFGSEINNQFVHGMATFPDKVIILLDASKLLNANELYRLTRMAVPEKSVS